MRVVDETNTNEFTTLEKNMFYDPWYDLLLFTMIFESSDISHVGNLQSFLWHDKRFLFGMLWSSLHLKMFYEFFDLSEAIRGAILKNESALKRDSAHIATSKSLSSLTRFKSHRLRLLTLWVLPCLMNTIVTPLRTFT